MCQLLDSFSALSLLQACPSPPLQAELLVCPPAPLVCPPVTLDEQSEGTRAQFFLCYRCLHESEHLSAATQTLYIPECTTGDVVRVTRVFVCANEKLTSTQTGANGANVTPEIYVECLLWDVVKAEKRDAIQAATLELVVL